MASAWGSSWGSAWGNSWGTTTGTTTATVAGGGGIAYVRRLRGGREETEEERRARIFAEFDAADGLNHPKPEPPPPVPPVAPVPALEAKKPKRGFVRYDDAPWRAMLAEAERLGQEQFAENVEQRIAEAAGLLADTAAQRRRNEEDAMAVILMAVLA